MRRKEIFGYFLEHLSTHFSASELVPPTADIPQTRRSTVVLRASMTSRTHLPIVITRMPQTCFRHATKAQNLTLSVAMYYYLLYVLYYTEDEFFLFALAAL